MPGQEGFIAGEHKQAEVFMIQMVVVIDETRDVLGMGNMTWIVI